MKFFGPGAMGTPLTSGILDLGAGVLTSPMGPRVLGLSSEGQRSSVPTILSALCYLGPFPKLERLPTKDAKFINDNIGSNSGWHPPCGVA